MAAIFDDTFVDPMPQQPQPNSAGDAAAQRYCFLDEVNSGSFGVVYRAWDNEAGEVVAIKHEMDGLTQSTMREITILESLPPHPSVVGLKQVVVDEHRLVLVVMDYLPTDLHRLIHEEKRRMPFTLSEVKKMTRQILEGVAFLHGNGVMHRDLKPANVLIDTKKDQLKICDFGMSRYVVGGESGKYTPRVVTKWYRAPELFRNATNYTSAIDMWSVGCIMGELVLGEVLFKGNDSEINQMRCIRDNMEESGYRLRERLGAAGRSGRGPGLSVWGMDLLMRMLEMDVEKRITAQQALNHPWFNEFYGLQLEN